MSFLLFCFPAKLRLFAHQMTTPFIITQEETLITRSWNVLDLMCKSIYVYMCVNQWNDEEI